MEENIKRLNEITVHDSTTKAHKKMIKMKRSESRKNRKLKKRGLYNKAEAKKRMKAIDDNFISEIEKITSVITLPDNVKIEADDTFILLGNATINGSYELKNAYVEIITQPVNEQLKSIRELNDAVDKYNQGKKKTSGIIGKLINGYKKLANFFNE